MPRLLTLSALLVLGIAATVAIAIAGRRKT